VQCEPANGCGTTAPLLIEDSEIDCTGFGASGFVGQGTGIEAENFTIRRVDIHACENGVSAGEDVLIEDSYIHGLYNDNVVPPPDGAHADGVQFGGSHNEAGRRAGREEHHDPPQHDRGRRLARTAPRPRATRSRSGPRRSSPTAARRTSTTTS
jgi:hypothetical protein